MKSLDTNILYFATNAGSPEHSSARALLESIRSRPSDWIISDQVLFEYYRLVRNPKVLEKPLSAREAGRRLEYFRNQLGCLHCAYDQSLFSDVFALLEQQDFAASRTFDMVLAVTLKKNGVKTFYTRNVRDFADLGWFTVIDPTA